MNKAITVAAGILLACVLGSAHAQQTPPKKGQSSERKPTTTARGGYDIKKGTAATKKDSKSGSTTARRPGTDFQGTDAQGIARE